MRAKALLITAAAFAAGLILFVVWQLDASPSSPAGRGEVPAPARSATVASEAEESGPGPLALEASTGARDGVQVAAPAPSAEVETVAVMVTDAAGAPIEGAEVRSEIDDYRTFQVTDASGKVRVPLAKGGAAGDVTNRAGARLHVDAEGYHHANEWGTSSKKVEVTLRRLATIAGRVIANDTSAGVGGAEVWLSDFPCGLCVAPRALTNAAGEFELHDLPLEARSLVRASAEGYVAGERSFVLREDDSTLELWLDPGRELWLEVSDFETGAAIEGARIARRGAADVEVPPTGRVQSSELLRRDDDEGAVRMKAHAAGYCTLDFQVDARTLEAGELVRLRVPRAATIEGVVRDPSGAPVAGARVTPGEDWKSFKQREATRASTPLDDLTRGWKLRLPEDQERVWTDAEGRFVLDGFVPWSWWNYVRITADGHDELEQSLTPGPPGSVLAVAITVHPTLTGDTGAVRGTMTLNGQGLGGRITWRGPSAAGSGHVDDQGNYELAGVEPGRVHLLPRPHHWEQACAEAGGEWTVEVVAGVTSTLDIAFEQTSAHIRGRVLASSTTPAAQVRVQAEAEGGCMVHRTVTDSEGRFTLVVDASFMAYDVSVREGPDPVRVHGIAPGSEGVVLKLSELSTLRYRVVDRDTQRPIVESRLLWRRPGENSYRTRGSGRRGLADPEGWHEVEFAEGTYDLGISLARDDTDYLPTFVDGVHLGEEGGKVLFEVERGLELELLNGGERTTKKNKKKKPWAKGVTVLLLDVEYLDDVTYRRSKNSWKWGPDLAGTNPLGSWKVSFDRLGTARVSALRPGRHRFRAYPPEIRIHPAEIDVRPNMEPLEIRWSKRQD